MKITGKQFVAAIIAVLKEKNTPCVSFDPKSYDAHLTKSELPWCNTFDCMADTIGCPALVIGDESIAETAQFSDGDKEQMMASGYPDCLWICVDDEGAVKYDFFNGSEDEDWEHLFFDVYDELRDGKDEEADFWLDEFIRQYRSSQSNKAVDKAKAVLINQIKERILAEDGSVLRLDKTVRIDKLNLDFDEYLPMTVRANFIDLDEGNPSIEFDYPDVERWMHDRCFLRDMSLSDVQNILYATE